MGGLFAHSDKEARTVANLDFKARCVEAKVLPILCRLVASC